MRLFYMILLRKDRIGQMSAVTGPLSHKSLKFKVLWEIWGAWNFNSISAVPAPGFATSGNEN